MERDSESGEHRAEPAHGVDSVGAGCVSSRPEVSTRASRPRAVAARRARRGACPAALPRGGSTHPAPVGPVGDARGASSAPVRGCRAATRRHPACTLPGFSSRHRHAAAASGRRWRCSSGMRSRCRATPSTGRSRSGTGRPRAAVVEHAGSPVVFLGPGTHVLTGAFGWDAVPAALGVPDSAALVELVLGGTRIVHPERDEEGRLFLVARTAVRRTPTGWRSRCSAS